MIPEGRITSISGLYKPEVGQVQQNNVLSHTRGLSMSANPECQALESPESDTDRVGSVFRVLGLRVRTVLLHRILGLILPIWQQRMLCRKDLRSVTESANHRPHHSYIDHTFYVHTNQVPKVDQYFVKRGETIKGPIGRRSLLRLIAAQKLIDTDGVASNEQGPWKNLVDVRELLLENSNPIIKSSIPVVREWKVCRRLFRRYRVDLKCPNCSEGISITKGKMPTQDTCPNCDVLFALPGSVSDWIEDDMRIRGYDPAAIIEKDNSIIAQVELPFSRHELICRYMKGMGVLLLCGGPIIVFYSFNRWRGSLVNVFPGLNDFVGFCVLLLLIYSAGSAVLMGLFASLRSLDKTHPKVVDRIESALTIATAIGVLGAIIFVVYWSHEEGDVLGSVLFALLITGFMVLPLFAVSKFLEQKNVSIRIFVPIDSDDDGDTDGFIGF